MAGDWDGLYRRRGVVQSGVLPLVEEAVVLFKRAGGVDRVLDLGCGSGRHLVYLAGEGFEVFGLDSSARGLELASGLLEEAGFKAAGLVEADMRSLCYADGFFDAVVSTNVIQHALSEGIRMVASEVRRVLRPGGFVVLKTLSVNDVNFGLRREVEPHTFLGDEEGEEDVPHHFFTREELRSLFSGFTVLRLEEVSAFSRRAGKVRTSFDLIARKD